MFGLNKCGAAAEKQLAEEIISSSTFSLSLSIIPYLCSSLATCLCDRHQDVSFSLSPSSITGARFLFLLSPCYISCLLSIRSVIRREQTRGFPEAGLTWLVSGSFGRVWVVCRQVE